MKKDEYEKLPQLIRSFMTHLEVIVNRSHLTASEYALNIRSFFRFVIKTRGMVDESIEYGDIDLRFLDDDVDFLKSISLNDAYEYILYCKNVLGNEAAARARKVSAMRTFFHYLAYNVNLLDSDPMALLNKPKVKRPLPKYLTLEESHMILSVIDGEYKIRDTAIVTLFLNCGLRLSELTNIDISDIKNGNVLTVTGKGSKQRALYLNESCVEALNRYMELRLTQKVKFESKNALFISRQGNRISNQAVQLLINKYYKLAGLSDKGYTTHTLRHTAATLMYQYGDVDILVLKEVLGHENLDTTKIYTHLSNENVKTALKNNPLNKLKSK